MRDVLSEGASLVVADERVGEALSAPADFNDRLMYAFSVTHCLPATMAEEPSQATGTVLRPAMMRSSGTKAGFSSVDELPVEHDFWRLYRFQP